MHSLAVRRLALLVLLALPALSLPLLRAADAAADTAEVVDEVHYTYTGPTSVTFDWRGAAQDLRFGTTAAYGSTVTGVAPTPLPFSSPGPFQEARVTGLAGGTTYHYSLGGGPDHVFATAPTGSYRFDVIGDVGDSAHFSGVTPTMADVAADRPAFVAVVGDITYANPDGQSAVDSHFNDVQAWSHRSDGVLSAAYLPVWGNHEWTDASSDDFRNYKGRFELPNPQTSPGAPALGCCGEDWSWYDAGGVRFLSYPEPYTSATWTDWQQRADAVMASAQADPSVRFVVTMGHRPAYSTGFHPGDTRLASILDGLGDRYGKYVLNLNGHSHDYERFQPIHGVTHVTTGGGGGGVEPPWSGTDVRTVYRTLHQHHLRVDVTSGGLHVEAVCGPATSKDDLACTEGSVMDAFDLPGAGTATTLGSTVYVDQRSTSCSDSGTGTPAVPFCTIGTAAVRAGGARTVVVEAGDYHESVVVSNNGATTGPAAQPCASGTPLVFTAAPGAAVTLSPGTKGIRSGFTLTGRCWVTIRGFTVTGTTQDGIIVNSSSHITLSNNHVTYAGRPVDGATYRGVRLNAVTDSLLADNTLDHNSDSGLYLDAATTRVRVERNTSAYNARTYIRLATGLDVRGYANTLLGNVTHDNEDSGLQFYSPAHDNLVTDNLSYRNDDHGIDDYGAPRQRIVGNTVHANATAGINLEGNSTAGWSTGGVVTNNVATDNGVLSTRTAGNVRVDPGSIQGTVVDGDLVALPSNGTMFTWGLTKYATLGSFQQASGQEARGISAPALYRDAAAADFHLQAGSRAIDSADSAVGGEQDSDADANPRVDAPLSSNAGSGPRGYDDRGAYEYQPPANTAPTTALAVTPSTGAAPLVVTADASASTDTDDTPIAGYRFYFGDGAVVVPASGATATHTYSTPGTYEVSATAVDSSGLNSTTTREVTVTPPPPNTAPVAAVSVTPASGTAPLDVTADASLSRDDDASPIAGYSFDFGDGTVLAPSSGTSAQHRYSTPGSYTVTVTATDTQGLSDRATAAVVVSAPADAAPVASLVLTPATGATPLLVSADAAASSDSDATPVATYLFDFGDGTVVGPHADATAAHSYALAGTYAVTVTVTDTAGLRGTATRQVVADGAPKAALVLSPSVGTAPLVVRADAAGSTDGDDTPVARYTFDFGDGSAAVGPQSGAAASHTYAAAGSYTVTVAVTDTGGLVGRRTAAVQVDAPDAAPSARLSVNPAAGATPLPVLADATASTDPDAFPIADFRFDFGDGSVAGPQGSGTAAHTYAAAGTYTVTVTVTDTAGLSSTATATVAADAPPRAALRLSSTATVAGAAVDADAGATTDADATPVASFAFDFGDGTPVAAQPGATASHTWAKAGSYTVSVTATDTAGYTGRASATVTVAPADAAPVARLSGASSTTTALTVALDASASSDTDATPVSGYAFDFGDGSATVVQPAPTATHRYAVAGAYTATVQVSDTAGLVGTASATVVADAAPAAVLGLTPSSGTAPLTVTADPSGSSDADATPITRYDVDFGDGTRVVSQTATAQGHTYAAGTWTATLTVTDAAGLTGTASRSVSVAAPPPDDPPVARVTLTPSSGAPGVLVTVDGSASTDTDATPIAAYSVDYGDGNTAVGGSAVTTHAFSAAGTYLVVLTATDTAGLTGSALARVVVTSPPPNLVGNPGFEVNTSGWNAASTTTTLTRLAGGHSGSWSVRAANTGTAATSCTLNDSPNWVTTTASGPYTAGLWVRADTAGAAVKVVLREYSGSTLVGSSSVSAVLATSWQQVPLRYTPVAPGSSTLDLQVYQSSAPVGTCFYADDVSITH